MFNIRRAPFLVGDIIFIFLAVWLAFLLRFEGSIPAQYLPGLWGLIFLALIIFPPVFYFFKLYSFSWIYVSAQELINLFKATLLSFLFLATAIFLLKENSAFTGFPRSTLFVSYFLIFLFCGAVRFSKRIYVQLLRGLGKANKEKTIIVGAGDAGEQILRSILSLKTSPFYPIGFADDSAEKQGVLIHGFKVLGKIEDIPRIVKEEEAIGMIIALPSAGSESVKRAVEKGRESGLRKIKIVPSAAQIFDGQVSITMLKELQVEDLLGRDPVSLDQSAIEDFIKERSVLVTGAAGSIGFELCRQIAKFNPSLLLVLDQDETGIFNLIGDLNNNFPKTKTISLVADIRDREKIERIFSQYGPSVVFHAAAYKHVPLMELHSDEAVKNNIFGTKIVAESALKYGSEKFIFISTDKAVNPTSIMGSTKRMGEMICQALNGQETKFISVRFGNVLDSRGSVIPIFKEQIKKGGPIEITHPEMKRYFMVTSEACLLVLQAGAMGHGGEVFVLDMGKPIKIVELAKELIRLAGFEPDKDIPIVFTEPRPGEKFFEEILTAEEGTVATKNQKIFMAKLSKIIDQEKLNSKLEPLRQSAEKGDGEAIISVLKDIIPTYRPPNNH